MGFLEALSGRTKVLSFEIIFDDNKVGVNVNRNVPMIPVPTAPVMAPIITNLANNLTDFLSMILSINNLFKFYLIEWEGSDLNARPHDYQSCALPG